MSEIATLLKDYSVKIGEGSLVKQAAAQALAEKGLNAEVAVSLLDRLGVGGMDPSLSNLPEILEKTAAYIEDLEGKLASAEEKAHQIEKSAEISSLNLNGFDETELKSLQSLPKATLEKIASMSDNPWTMGTASGATSVADMDPLTAFILS